MFHPKNIHATLKRKRLKSVSNIMKVYNIRTRNNKVTRGLRSEMQHLFKLLEDDYHVFMYRVCENRKIVRDIFCNHPGSIKLFNKFPICVDNRFNI